MYEKNGWDLKDVDILEINEEFEVVEMEEMRDIEMKKEKVNINGGECEIGKKIGEQGESIIVKMMEEIEKNGMKRGIEGI